MATLSKFVTVLSLLVVSTNQVSAARHVFINKGKCKGQLANKRAGLAQYDHMIIHGAITAQRCGQACLLETPLQSQQFYRGFTYSKDRTCACAFDDENIPGGVSHDKNDLFYSARGEIQETDGNTEYACYRYISS